MSKITQTEIAKQVGVSPGFISQIVNGHSPCPKRLAPRLERITGIDRRVWIWGTTGEIRERLEHFFTHGKTETGGTSS